MKRIILLSIMLCILAGCKKELLTADSSNIIGKWEWLSTCGGFTGECGTPQTSNTTAKLVFNQDSVFSEFRNNSLFISYRFSILKTPVNYTFGKFLINNTNYNYSVISDTLIFMVEGSEFSSMYKRIK
jgi:hypothetical protein